MVVSYVLRCMNGSTSGNEAESSAIGIAAPAGISKEKSPFSFSELVVADNPVNEMVRRLISTLRWVILLAGSRRIIDMQIRSVGIDLGKTTFHVVALSAA